MSAPLPTPPAKLPRAKQTQLPPSFMWQSGGGGGGGGGSAAAAAPAPSTPHKTNNDGDPKTTSKRERDDEEDSEHRDDDDDGNEMSKKNTKKEKKLKPDKDSTAKFADANGFTLVIVEGVAAASYPRNYKCGRCDAKIKVTRNDKSHLSDHRIRNKCVAKASGDDAASATATSTTTTLAKQQSTLHHKAPRELLAMLVASQRIPFRIANAPILHALIASIRHATTAQVSAVQNVTRKSLAADVAKYARQAQSEFIADAKRPFRGVVVHHILSH